MLIDSHCHINFSSYKDDSKEVIARALDDNISIINIGSQYSTSQRTIKIAEQYDKNVYAVVGLHPVHLNDDITESAVIDGVKHEIVTKKEEFDYSAYRDLARSSDKVVGLGEVGLDYYYFDETTDIASHKRLQKQVFQKFLELSHELDLPLVIHTRGSRENPYDAYDDILTTLKNSGLKIRGVVHCFGGSLLQAQEFVKLGFYIGFTGIITFKNKVEEAQSIVAKLPLNKMLVETDAPFLSPVPHRGKRNEPAYVRFVAMKMAELKNISFEEVSKVTVQNTKELFRL
jgi:TatD DNase family protein